ncbi:hypothetical protein [Clostridium cellulovorans]|uniref:Uncharacterized protein n=1 Tax=Clostridium cellulovorans (strain ATCC 35296 / DSM 3052 / OCM 3 / 743B) TaxID=573061 RepID=D9SRL9_CLOC7|nr:hypothetical protein [Clostridium cellulovorans]ADL50386.1 hypothetical protein Clocel_0615 [Clostridium cellulovorans 743B]
MFNKIFQVKKIIALVLTLTFAYLAINGSISSESFLTVFTTVVAFYFGQSTARQSLADSYSTLTYTNNNNNNNNNPNSNFDNSDE